MSTKPAIATLLALLVLGAPCSAAESEPGEIPTWLKPGATLRLRLEGPGESRSITAQYVRHDDSTLSLGTGSARLGDTVEVRRDRIVRLEVSQERGSHAWRGFGLGFLAVGIASTAALLSGSEFDDPGEKAVGAFLGATYGSLGALVGAAVGGSIPKDRWTLIWNRSRGGGS